MNELQSISQLFQNRLFRIPDYQRGYAWKTPQLTDFWDDLLNLQEGRYHYTGLLSLRQLTGAELRDWGEDAWLVESGYKPCHVVDGQQRLTTISILLNELVAFVKNLPQFADSDEENSILGYESLKEIRTKYISRTRPPQGMITTYLFGYEVDNPSADYLKYRVFNAPFGGAVDETYYTKNLKNAKDFFNTNLSSLYGLEGLDGLTAIYKKLTQKMMFNIHEIADDYDVFVAFETMNNRGKPLSNLELLKNRLIYLATLFDDATLDNTDKQALRKRINDCWKEVYYQLGRNRSISLSDDEFLRAHWIMFFQYSRQKGTDYISFLLSYFSPKNIYEKQSLTQPLPIDEAETDETEEDDDNISATETEMQCTSKLQPSEIDQYVCSLNETVKYWYYTHFPEESDLTPLEKQWMQRLNRIGIGYFRPLVTASLMPTAGVSTAQRIALFKAIERFIFICFRMGMFQSSYQSSVYNRRAKDLYFGNISADEITAELNTTIELDTKSAISNFVSRMDKHFTHEDGFYRWRDLRYMLYEYEVALSDQNKIQKIEWSIFSKSDRAKLSIEHILPQKPSKWYWRNQFRQYTEKEIKILSASLGNLLPLDQSINSSLQNDAFPDKRESAPSGRRGYKNGSHSEIEVANETDWDAQRIWDRGLRLLAFMETRWGFQFASEEQKIELLHLDFMKESRPDVPELSIDEGDDSGN